MLSYQHLYHAGNLADVHKHAVLVLLLEAITAKDRPLTYVDTHAGRGLYDLAAPEAKKTGEAKEGIERVLARGVFPENHPYIQALARVRHYYGKTAYPGSPMLAKMRLRPRDTLYLMELHPQEIEHLRKNIEGPNIRIRKRDGYDSAFSVARTAGGDGLVLIDPSFEVKTEYMQAAEFVRQVHEAWPKAVIALWYPLLKAGLHQPMVETLAEYFSGGPHPISPRGPHPTPLPSWRGHASHGRGKGSGGAAAAGDYTSTLFLQECTFADPAEVRGLYGSGLVLVNGPKGVEKKIEAVKTMLEKL